MDDTTDVVDVTNNTDLLVHVDNNTQTITESMLTTFDNPYNPFDDYDPWYAFDMAHGYRTLSLLDRVITTSDEFSPADQDRAHEEAIDEIVRENVSGMHKRVTREVTVSY